MLHGLEVVVNLTSSTDQGRPDQIVLILLLGDCF
jgi:hypothetical protein